MKVGIPNGALGRSSFFNSVGYDIGGLFYNFSELENGILRGNKKAPGQFSVPFADRDPRKKLVLEKADPRIHFALNCGAKSCPPVKKFSATAINEELRIVAQAFCEQEDNVFVDEKSNTLKLTKIMSWYGSDFSSSSQQLPEAIVPFLRGESQEKLLKMIESNKINKHIKLDNRIRLKPEISSFQLYMYTQKILKIEIILFRFSSRAQTLIYLKFFSV